MIWLDLGAFQFEYQSPRRAQPAQSQRLQQRMPEPQQPRIRLEPAVQSPLPRAETPDPFEQSPAEEEEHSYPDLMSPSSSTFNSKSRLPLSRRTSMLDPVLSTTLPPHQESDEESLDDEDMPLFPGSDLF